MRIDVLTIFPKMFDSVLAESIIKRAIKKGLVEINLIDIRMFSKDKHRKVDDRPFGGGPGMVMSVEPFFEAMDWLRTKTPNHKGSRQAKNPEPQGFEASQRAKKRRVILLSPNGKIFNHKLALKLSRYEHMVLLCGHYEGIDERVRRHLIDEEISIGDFVLTGGELAAMAIIDASARLLPGVLGNKDSSRDESFSKGLLEYPQYTRPANYKGMKVPRILLSGDHKKIKEWRKKQSLKLTMGKRPDLIAK